MSWKAQEMVVIPASDLHCGDMPLGFVAGAFPFVPCHVPFFAAVPAAVEGLGMPDRRASYQAVETLFQRCLRFTPLYVLHEGRALFPWNPEDRRLLERHWLAGRSGVMLDERRSAVEGRLFETEVLLAAPRGLDGTTRLGGALFWRAGSEEGIELSDSGELKHGGQVLPLSKLLPALRLGGDRTRSLGLLETVETHGLSEGDALWGLYPVLLNGEWPGLRVPGGEAGPLPLAADSNDLHGEWTVLTGRRHKAASGSGLSMDAGRVARKAGWRHLDRDQAVEVLLSTPRAASLKLS